MKHKDYGELYYAAVFRKERGAQMAIGEYCDAEGNNECYRIYYNGRYFGVSFLSLGEAADYIKKSAEEWHSTMIRRAFACDIPYTGLKWKPKKIRWLLLGPFPGYKLRNDEMKWSGSMSNEKSYGDEKVEGILI